MAAELADTDQAGAAASKELALRLADVQRIVATIKTDDDGEITEEHTGGILSALDYALRGDPGCIEPEEWQASRERALYADLDLLREVNKASHAFGTLRGLRHAEKRATDELDKAGVEKYDDGDGQGGEWALWIRIQRLARDRDQLASADAGALMVDRDRWRAAAQKAGWALSSIRAAMRKHDGD